MVVPSLNEGLHQKLGRSTKQKRDGVRPSETCKEKYCVRHIFTRIPHDTCPFSRSTQEQEHLDCHECRGHVERLEHKTNHAFSVVLRIHGSFREQDGGMFLKRDPEYVVESLVADWARTTEGACDCVRIQHLSLWRTQYVRGGRVQKSPMQLFLCERVVCEKTVPYVMMRNACQADHCDISLVSARQLRPRASFARCHPSPRLARRDPHEHSVHTHTKAATLSW